MRILTSEETPLDWESRKIGYYVEKHKGGAPLKPSDFSESGFPVIPKKAIQPGNQLVIKEQTYCTTQFADENTRSIVDNSYTITTLRDLVPTGPTIGTVVNFYTDEQYILSQGVYGLKLKDKISRDYFAYLSNTSLYRNVMRRVMVGSTQVHIRTPEYLNLEIQTPPLPEQRKIAKILSTWDKAIATNEKLIATSKQQKKALMQQLLTGKKRLVNPETGKAFEGEWEEVKFEDIVLSTQLGTTNRTIDIEDKKTIPLLKMGNLTWGGFNYEKLEELPVSQVEQKLILNEGDFLFNTRNTPELVGKSAVWTGGIKQATFDNNINRITFVSTIDPYYLCFYLTNGKGKSKINSLPAGSTSVAAIYWKDLKNIRLEVPKTNEQQKIASVLTAADKEIEVLEAKLAYFKQEKKALMQQLLTGKRRVHVE
ncbi:restriction endonuclease subunit S [Vibrio alginolyticus]|uniref:restriction endonuclease subunit S n=1 Tax=Vibrio alginolyticus TaxID=663 RepID=UPI0037545C20